jgi:hypothetical protein
MCGWTTTPTSLLKDTSILDRRTKSTVSFYWIEHDWEYQIGWGWGWGCVDVWMQVIVALFLGFRWCASWSCIMSASSDASVAASDWVALSHYCPRPVGLATQIVLSPKKKNLRPTQLCELRPSKI